MILLLDADKEDIHYCLKDNDRTLEQGSDGQIGLLKKKLCLFHKDYGIKMVGYRVVNGGDFIDRSVMELTESLAAPIGKLPCFGPNSDVTIKKLFHFCQGRLEGPRHFALCDSAFFLNVPGYAKAYAIPLEYTQAGLVKNGRNGIVHEWAVQRLIAQGPLKKERTISVFLNNGADVVALKDGRPVMTGQGFSDFDGIMSQTGCGAIDTSIVFQLCRAGYTLEDIDQVLAQESGFKALVCRKQGLYDLIIRKDLRARKAMDIFSYQLTKAIGACAGVLGGIDSVVVVGDDQKDLCDWAVHFMRQLGFLGPGIEAHYFGFDKWSLWAKLIEEQGVPSR